MTDTNKEREIERLKKAVDDNYNLKVELNSGSNSAAIKVFLDIAEKWALGFLGDRVGQTMGRGNGHDEGDRAPAECHRHNAPRRALTMKPILIVLILLAFAGCTFPQTYVYYHDRWMTEQEYQRIIAEETSVEFVLD